MVKRYEVFVSSTSEDLTVERREVMQALLRQNCFPTGMELFPAADATAWALIKSTIEQCDYYLLILGGRYGSTDQRGIGYTEKEYNHAVKLGKPIIAFLHRNPEQLPLEKSERSPGARKKLARFCERVKKRHCAFWLNPEDLAAKVGDALTKLQRETPAIGWVRPPVVADKSISLFLASPMAAFPENSEYREDRKRVSHIIKAFRAYCRFGSIYYAGTTLASKADFDPENISLAANIKALEQSQHFVLIYPRPLPSSVLVEAGIALALKLPSAYFVRSKTDLPFLLQNPGEAERCIRVYEYTDTNHIIGLVKKYSRELFPTADKEI